MKKYQDVERDRAGFRDGHLLSLHHRDWVHRLQGQIHFHSYGLKFILTPSNHYKKVAPRLSRLPGSGMAPNPDRYQVSCQGTYTN